MITKLSVRDRALTTVLAALATACGAQGGNSQQEATRHESGSGGQAVLADLCVVARHPERVDGQRLRLRAIFVPDVEFERLTSGACRGGRWDGYVGIVRSREWDHSGIRAALAEADRRSSASQTLAVEAEFEGILHARLRPAPLNHVGPTPAFVGMLEVAKVDHVRLVIVPAHQTTPTGAG